MKRKFVWMAAVAGVCAVLVACGGGGGSSSTSSTNNGSTQTGGTTAGTNTPTTTTTTTASTFADASAVPVSSNATNAMPILVSAPFGSSSSIRNFPMVSVVICTANTNAAGNCVTIPNVLVDTGSYGLRVFASTLTATQLSAFTNVGVGGGTTAECAGFGSGDTWGTVRAADVKLSGEIATNVSIQVIGDSANLSATMPTTDCTTGKSITTVSQLGANGILGIGSAVNDCGANCASQAVPGTYYSCTGTTCTAIAVPVVQQVSNPVASFPTDNNGVIVEMAQVADTGASTGTGTLVFGIDTQSNNALAGTSATILPTDDVGNLTAVFNGRTYTNGAFMDSGSNGLFFGDASLPTNSSGFFIPASATGLTATLTAADSTTATVQFNVGNATTLFNSGNFAFNNLAASIPGNFDLGIPFYYGRHVYHGIVGRPAAGSVTGPYVAYTSS
ncbi:DUF3443 domain-containing protein [Paraburkholderia sp.]|uniref:DUF3443 domain-containing protein n=1 Tax=Paraburkholderia sp. TaxID=1926495 RepID=UPI003D6EC002